MNLYEDTMILDKQEFNQSQNVQMDSVVDLDTNSISKREFINKYASPAYGKSIIATCIIFYIGAGITALHSIFTNPIGIIDALLLAGLALGLHLSKMKKSAKTSLGWVLAQVITCVSPNL